jgi:protein-S-isoprenylcysteine O-methyltransferase Ste14
LGRNFGLVAARRQLVLGGPYRFMRHPMYFGYLVTHLAVLGMNPSMSNAGFYLLSWVAQLPRLLAEERVLSEDPAYADYMRTVRWRLVPGIW